MSPQPLVALRRMWYVILLVAIALTSGCWLRSSEQPDPDNGGASTNSTGHASRDYASRFEAASAITNSGERDKALTAVAIDAAKGGDGETVKKCVAAFSNSSTRDDSAYKAAVELSRSGYIADAKAVAEMIGSSSKRDDALSAIAKGT